MYDKKIKKVFEYMSELKHKMCFEDKLLHLANMAKDIIDADRCSIWSFDPKKMEFTTKVAHGVDTLCMSSYDGMVGYCFLTGETLMIDDVYQSDFFDPTIDKQTGYKTKSAVTTPIINNNGHTIGVFQALNKQNEDKIFTADDQNLLELITTYVSEVLESTLLHKELQDKQSELKNINKNLSNPSCTKNSSRY